MFGAFLYIAQRPGHYENWSGNIWRALKWSEKVTNEKCLGRIGEKRTLLNNILPRKDNWIGHMTEVKGVGRRTQLLDDLRNRRRYWELKEEAEDRKRWRRQFINRT